MPVGILLAKAFLLRVEGAGEIIGAEPSITEEIAGALWSRYGQSRGAGTRSAGHSGSCLVVRRYQAKSKGERYEEIMTWYKWNKQKESYLIWGSSVIIVKILAVNI